ncbi:hypothetical protein FI667_g7929, partial [Globisporangium splendens]
MDAERQNGDFQVRQAILYAVGSICDDEGKCPVRFHALGHLLLSVCVCACVPDVRAKAAARAAHARAAGAVERDARTARRPRAQASRSAGDGAAALRAPRQPQEHQARRRAALRAKAPKYGRHLLPSLLNSMCVKILQKYQREHLTSTGSSNSNSTSDATSRRRLRRAGLDD